jgi:hypothetical protein
MRSECWALGRWFLMSGLGLALLGLAACGTALDYEAQAKRKSYQERYAKAKALFEERCKTAGVVIHRTVKDVEGIELSKIRPEIPWGGREYFDPMFPGAAMAAESQGNSYVQQFLFTEFRDPPNLERRGLLVVPKGIPSPGRIGLRGYRYVEQVDPATGQRMRFTLPADPNAVRWAGPLEREVVHHSSTRYALDYEDIVDPADRSHWVAGTRLKVLDRQTGEVIAEMTRFVWDPGFGVSTTGRWPWRHASSFGPSRECPSEEGVKNNISRAFIDAVLIPKQGD